MIEDLKKIREVLTYYRDNYLIVDERQKIEEIITLMNNVILNAFRLEVQTNLVKLHIQEINKAFKEPPQFNELII